MVVAIAALAPGVLVPPSVMVVIVRAFPGLDHAAGHHEHESQQ
jgi:hypothetical protein